jgi:hypothetical protein
MSSMMSRRVMFLKSAVLYPPILVLFYQVNWWLEREWRHSPELAGHGGVCRGSRGTDVLVRAVLVVRNVWALQSNFKRFKRL